MFPFSGLLLISIVLVVCWESLKLLWRRFKGELPAGPFPVPLIGNMLSIDPIKPFVSLSQLADKYGKIFTVMMGNNVVVVLADVQLIRDAFRDDRFSGRPVTVFHQLECNMEKGNLHQLLEDNR